MQIALSLSREIRSVALQIATAKDYSRFLNCCVLYANAEASSESGHGHVVPHNAVELQLRSVVKDAASTPHKTWATTLRASDI